LYAPESNHDNIQWWYDSGLVAQSARLIGQKMNIPDLANTYFAFIDCNCMETSRPGGGPCEEGANSRRWDPDIQRAYYNGWKSIHGLKHQTIDNAMGMTMDVYGPTSVRRNDLTLYRLSGINERIGRLSANEEYDYCVFGDSAYGVDTHFRSYIKNSCTSLQKQWNRSMTSVRISIEWNYMATASLWPYVGSKRKLKILQSTRISRIYITATLLRNFHSCLYGNETSKYFGYVFPEDFLETYINQRL
jgi:hypothetical protein